TLNGQPAPAWRDHCGDPPLSCWSTATLPPGFLRRISSALERSIETKLGLEPSEVRPGGLLYRCARGEFALFASSGKASGEHTQIPTAPASPAASVDARVTTATSSFMSRCRMSRRYRARRRRSAECAG